MSTAHGSIPTVWYFLPCDRIDRWGGGPYSLSKVRLEIPNPLERPPPRLYPHLHLYLVLTNGTGVHTLQIQQTCLRDQTQVYRWPPFTIDLGDDPTAIHEAPQKLEEVVFWASGQCEFLLYCGNHQLAEAVLDVR